jgi:hypothetical protein
MRSLEEPEAPRGRGLLWILLVLAMLGGAAAWYATTRLAPPVSPAPPQRGASEPAAPSSANEPAGTTERKEPASSGIAPRPTPSRPGNTDRAARVPATPATARREFRVTSDVPGAYVFLNRKFLGTTPFASREIAPGTYQLNVQTEGRPPVVRTVDVTPDGLTEVAVTIPAAAPTAAAASTLRADVPVVHQHAMGSCEGTLRASADGFRYDTPHKDAFALPYASVETFTVDYAEKRLRLKQRGGRSWNFTTTAVNADPLFVFHRDVEAARR